MFIRSFIICVSLIFSPQLLAQGFNEDGFKSGTAKADVRNIVLSTSHTNFIWNDAENLYGFHNTTFGKFFIFGFCKDKLVSLLVTHRDDTALVDLITLLEETTKTYGATAQITTGTRLLASGIGGGQAQDLTIVWNKPDLIVRVSTSVLIGNPKSKSGMLTRELVVRNTCSIGQ